MIDIITWNPVTGSTQTFNSTDPFPVQDFDVRPDYRIDNSRQIPGAHSVYPTPTERDGMSIDMTFAILADDMSDYVAKRKQVMNRLNGTNFDGPVTLDLMGTLSIQFTGEAETWDADCTISAVTGPKTAQEGAYSDVMVTFYSFKAYFYGGTDPTNFYRWT